MTVIVACDLDRTLIYSAGFVDPAQGAAYEVPVCVEHYHGDELSYMTAPAVRLLAALAARCAVVPTTTRTVAQYQRVDIAGFRPRYAITSNGGNILVDGVVDRRWTIQTQARLEWSGTPIDVVAAELAGAISDDWVLNFRLADELFCYLVVEPDRIPLGFMADWSAWCSARGWTVSMQGRKIYTVPTALGKSHAVAEIRRRLTREGGWAGSTVLAAGDGALDAELLTYADAAIRPRHGELEALGWQSANTAVTGSGGLVAGEEIVQWLSDMVDAVVR